MKLSIEQDDYLNYYDFSHVFLSYCHVFQVLAPFLLTFQFKHYLINLLIMQLFVV